MNENDRFTNGKRRVATAEECSAKWGLDSHALRCDLCGHTMKPGDGWRWIYSAGASFISPADGKKWGLTNLTVCDACDGPDAMERWAERHREFYSDRFWALR